MTKWLKDISKSIKSYFTSLFNKFFAIGPSDPNCAACDQHYLALQIHNRPGLKTSCTQQQTLKTNFQQQQTSTKTPINLPQHNTIYESGCSKLVIIIITAIVALYRRQFQLFLFWCEINEQWYPARRTTASVNSRTRCANVTAEESILRPHPVAPRRRRFSPLLSLIQDSCSLF